MTQLGFVYAWSIESLRTILGPSKLFKLRFRIPTLVNDQQRIHPGSLWDHGGLKELEDQMPIKKSEYIQVNAIIQDGWCIKLYWLSLSKLTVSNNCAMAFLSPFLHSSNTYAGGASSLLFVLGVHIRSIRALAACLKLNCRARRQDPEFQGLWA